MTIRPSTRDAIIEAGFQLYNEDPTASLAQIAERAGIGRATLHRHFGSRDELMETLAAAALEEIDNTATLAAEHAKTHAEALERMMAAIVPLADRHWFLSREPVENYPAVAAEIRRQEQEMMALMEAVKDEGAIDKNVATAWAVQVFDNLIFAAWEMVRTEQATPAQASAWAWQTFTGGLGN